MIAVGKKNGEDAVYHPGSKNMLTPAKKKGCPQKQGRTEEKTVPRILSSAKFFIALFRRGRIPCFAASFFLLLLLRPLAASHLISSHLIPVLLMPLPLCRTVARSNYCAFELGPKSNLFRHDRKYYFSTRWLQSQPDDKSSFAP